MSAELPRDVHWLTAANLAAVPGLAHGFSTRVSARPGEDEVASTAVQAVTQVHGTDIMIPEDRLAEPPEDAPPGEFDGLATARSGLGLAVRTADCVPVLLADREGRAVAALHAGWRGTLAGMAAVGVRVLAERFGCPAAGLVAAVGPAIGACCFEVGREVAAPFSRQFGPEVVRRDLGPRPHVDLVAANRRALVAAGVPAAAVEVVSLCTRCRDDLFHSYRRDGAAAGRQWSWVRLGEGRAGP